MHEVDSFSISFPLSLILGSVFFYIFYVGAEEEKEVKRKRRSERR
jgi:hypothetical protein